MCESVAQVVAHIADGHDQRVRIAERDRVDRKITGTVGGLRT